MTLGSCDSHLTKLLPQHGSQKIRARSHQLTRPARSERGRTERSWGSLETGLNREYSPRPSLISTIPITRKIFQSASWQQLRKYYWQASNKSSAHKALKFTVTLPPESSYGDPKFPPWPLSLLETQVTNPKACRAEEETDINWIKAAESRGTWMAVHPPPPASGWGCHPSPTQLPRPAWSDFLREFQLQRFFWIAPDFWKTSVWQKTSQGQPQSANWTHSSGLLFTTPPLPFDPNQPFQSDCSLLSHKDLFCIPCTPLTLGRGPPPVQHHTDKPPTCEAPWATTKESPQTSFPISEVVSKSHKHSSFPCTLWLLIFHLGISSSCLAP